jgi:hypothetical protein
MADVSYSTVTSDRERWTTHAVAHGPKFKQMEKLSVASDSALRKDNWQTGLQKYARSDHQKKWRQQKERDRGKATVYPLAPPRGLWYLDSTFWLIHDN